MDQRGFTLIELVVTLIVLAIIMAIAAPSVADLRDRQALRGTADSLMTAVGLARQEAIKRNALVRVDFQPLGNGVCVGAAVVATDDATTGCDCSAAACALAAFPVSPTDVSDLRNIRLSVDPAFGDDGGFVIDPRTGILANLSDTGSLTLESVRGYVLRIDVGATGRVSSCVPSGAEKVLIGANPC